MIAHRIADKALGHSRAIITVRKARRHSSDKVFWWLHEKRLEEQMVSQAKMLERLLTFKSGMKDGWRMWQENHSP